MERLLLESRTLMEMFKKFKLNTPALVYAMQLRMRSLSASSSDSTYTTLKDNILLIFLQLNLFRGQLLTFEGTHHPVKYHI